MNSSNRIMSGMKNNQILEKDIHQKYGMNMIMREVLIKVMQSSQHFVDILNYKFDEVLLIMDETLDTLTAQAPTVDAYDKIYKQINLSFQRVFEKIDELKLNALLASKACKRGRKDVSKETKLRISTLR
ncbi:unnamed protein product [Lactuca saligna]|uniref:Uncharacterized protein n=1 Tax=Lactuca saligna TaxID=75948 RepID=A0AA36EL10_LACSI|nr:unnamed protein product [Lactuca saligna]